MAFLPAIAGKASFKFQRCSIMPIRLEVASTSKRLGGARRVGLGQLDAASPHGDSEQGRGPGPAMAERGRGASRVAAAPFDRVDHVP
jgi:hypothetical protein